MDNYMYNNLKLCFPFIVEDAIDIYENGKNELIIKLYDGQVVSYDDLNRSIRKLPTSSMSEKEFRHEFSIRLQKLLYRSGLTQMDLSDMTGISQATISNYMTGKRSPSFYNLDKIAKALNCSIDDFRYVLK